MQTNKRTIESGLLIIIFGKMKAMSINMTLAESYLQMLDNLSTDCKLELISKLTLSVKSDISEKKKTFNNRLMRRRKENTQAY